MSCPSASNSDTSAKCWLLRAWSQPCYQLCLVIAGASRAKISFVFNKKKKHMKLCELLLRCDKSSWWNHAASCPKSSSSRTLRMECMQQVTASLGAVQRRCCSICSLATSLSKIHVNTTAFLSGQCRYCFMVRPEQWSALRLSRGLWRTVELQINIYLYSAESNLKASQSALYNQ